MPERFPRSLEDMIQPPVAAGKMRFRSLRVGVLAQINIPYLAGPLQHNELQVAHRVRLKSLQCILARLQLVTDGIDASEPFKVNIAV